MWVHVYGGMDRLVTHSFARVIPVHASELVNLLRRPAIEDQIVTNALEKRTSLHDLALANARVSVHLVTLPCQPGNVSRLLLPCQLARKGESTATDTAGNGANAGTAADLDVQHGTLLGTQMTVVLSHAGTPSDCVVLHLEVESKVGEVLDLLLAQTGR